MVLCKVVGAALEKPLRLYLMLSHTSLVKSFLRHISYRIQEQVLLLPLFLKWLIIAGFLSHHPLSLEFLIEGLKSLRLLGYLQPLDLKAPLLLLACIVEQFVDFGIIKVLVEWCISVEVRFVLLDLHGSLEIAIRINLNDWTDLS